MKKKSNKPLIIACTKFDSWRSLLDIELPDPWTKVDASHALNITLVERVSSQLQSVLMQFCPEVVASAQALSSNVYFVPVSGGNF